MSDGEHPSIDETLLGLLNKLPSEWTSSEKAEVKRFIDVGEWGFEAGPVPWTLSAWRRRVHQWPENVPTPIRRSFGSRSWNSPAPDGIRMTSRPNLGSRGKP